MGPKKLESTPQEHLFRSRPDNMICMDHELVKLSRLIRWEVFDEQCFRHDLPIHPSSMSRWRGRISKGKAHKRYEFGVKTSLATTNASGFVVGAQACPGNPYDGHTLAAQLQQVVSLTGIMPLHRPMHDQPPTAIQTHQIA